MEMEEYATVFPAVNQLELHPRFASPELRLYAAVRHSHPQPTDPLAMLGTAVLL